MTPDEHYREAERILKVLDPYTDTQEEMRNIIAEAQVHAILATIYRSTERLVEK